MLARNDFLGSGEGLPLPFLVRHGICSYGGRDPGFTLKDVAKSITAGNRRIYLAGVEANGVQLELSTTFFLPTLLEDGMIVGSQLCDDLLKHVSIERGIIIHLPDELASVHAWKYRPPDHAKDMSLYHQLFSSLDIDELPGDVEIIRKLCDRFPGKAPPTNLSLILAPYLAPGAVSKKWDRDEIVLSVGKKSIVSGHDDKIPLSRTFLSSNPILSFEGFLIPRSVAKYFQNSDQSGNSPMLTCVKNVILEY